MGPLGCATGVLLVTPYAVKYTSDCRPEDPELESDWEDKFALKTPHRPKDGLGLCFCVFNVTLLLYQLKYYVHLAPHAIFMYVQCVAAYLV